MADELRAGGGIDTAAFLRRWTCPALPFRRCGKRIRALTDAAVPPQENAFRLPSVYGRLRRGRPRARRRRTGRRAVGAAPLFAARKLLEVTPAGKRLRLPPSVRALLERQRAAVERKPASTAKAR
ncbi:MAG: hypothetical protein ACLUFV_01010 [Acutalibacteraceae bacterium]